MPRFLPYPEAVLWKVAYSSMCNANLRRSNGTATAAVRMQLPAAAIAATDAHFPKVQPNRLPAPL